MANNLATHEKRTADTDAEVAPLLRRCATGDRQAFRRLYDVQAPRLYGLALRITREPALAADAVHDALLQVWQRATQFDPSRGSAELALKACLGS